MSVLTLVVLMAFGTTSAWATETATTGAMTLDGAKVIALQHAQLGEDVVTITKMAIDRDDGRWEYEIEFIADGLEHAYEIDAETGEVLKSSTEKVGAKWSGIEGGQYLTLEEAKEKALAAVGVTAEQATFTEIQFDFDDRRAEYELEFTVGDTEYQVDLDAATGEILKQETEARRDER